MIPDDISTARRISQLETLVADLSRELSTLRSVAPDAIAPRERWLGRTTSASFSDYPTSGDTFQVELLACHFTPTPGTQAITEVSLGDKVVARTRPGTYLPRGTEVEVYRCRGMGPLGSGEWWISGGAASSSSSRCVITGGVSSEIMSTSGHVWTSGGMIAGSSWRYPTGFGDTRLRTFPVVHGETANAAGDVFRVRAMEHAPQQPGTFGDPWLQIVQPGHYSLHCQTTWSLGSLTYSESEQILKDWIAHNHGGAAAVSNARRWDESFVVVRTRAILSGVGVPSGMYVDTFLGSSTIPLFYADSANNTKFANHGGVIYLPYVAGSSLPLQVQLETYADLCVSGYWPQSTFRAYLHDMQVSVHQTSG